MLFAVVAVFALVCGSATGQLDLDDRLLKRVPQKYIKNVLLEGALDCDQSTPVAIDTFPALSCGKNMPELDPETKEFLHPDTCQVVSDNLYFHAVFDFQRASSLPLFMAQMCRALLSCVHPDNFRIVLQYDSEVLNKKVFESAGGRYNDVAQKKCKDAQAALVSASASAGSKSKSKRGYSQYMESLTVHQRYLAASSFLENYIYSMQNQGYDRKEGKASKRDKRDKKDKDRDTEKDKDKGIGIPFLTWTGIFDTLSLQEVRFVSLYSTASSSGKYAAASYAGYEKWSSSHSQNRLLAGAGADISKGDKDWPRLLEASNQEKQKQKEERRSGSETETQTSPPLSASPSKSAFGQKWIWQVDADEFASLVLGEGDSVGGGLVAPHQSQDGHTSSSSSSSSGYPYTVFDRMFEGMVPHVTGSSSDRLKKSHSNGCDGDVVYGMLYDRVKPNGQIVNITMNMMDTKGGVLHQHVRGSTENDLSNFPLLCDVKKVLERGPNKGAERRKLIFYRSEYRPLVGNHQLACEVNSRNHKVAERGRLSQCYKEHFRYYDFASDMGYDAPSTAAVLKRAKDGSIGAGSKNTNQNGVLIKNEVHGEGGKRGGSREEEKEKYMYGKKSGGTQEKYSPIPVQHTTRVYDNFVRYDQKHGLDNNMQGRADRVAAMHELHPLPLPRAAIRCDANAAVSYREVLAMERAGKRKKGASAKFLEGGKRRPLELVVEHYKYVDGIADYLRKRAKRFKDEGIPWYVESETAVKALERSRDWTTGKIRLDTERKDYLNCRRQNSQITRGVREKRKKKGKGN